ncbi:hypothetical protein S40288_10092 [Stachybotrys chartarum IBT 40288]|nr:hypothetical protein S40288_10092 [Stachybotrys chartarum IBT 40288]
MRRNLAETLRNQFFCTDDVLHACIRDGNLARLQTLLNATSPAPDLGYVHADYGPPLHFAVWCGDLDAVELLLAAGADPVAIAHPPAIAAESPCRYTPMHVAIRTGQLDVFRRLWSCAAPESHIRDNHSQGSLLNLAAEQGHARIVEDLLTWNGWHPDLPCMALTFAAACWHLDVVAVLLRKISFRQVDIRQALEAAVDHRAWGGPTPPTPEGLDYYNLQRLIELLLKTLETPFGKPLYGPYLLREAASNANSIGAFKTLLDNGAQPEGPAGIGYSTMHALALPVPVGIWSNGNQVMNRPAIEMLLQRGVSVTTPTTKGVDAPLHLAAFGSDLSTFRLFLTQSTNEDEDTLLALMNAEQETLLHYAAAGCQIEIMEFLILKGLDVNAQSSNGWTPLMCALTPTRNWPMTSGTATTMKTPAESTQAAWLLLSHGADPTIATEEGWTTLHALALHCDLDVRGRVAELAMKFIAHGVDTAVRAPLFTYQPIPSRTFGKPASPPQLDMPWGHRLRKTMTNTRDWRPFIIQASLTPLHWSAQRGAAGVVKALLAAGVDTAAVDTNGRSAVDMAQGSKTVAIRTEAADAILDLLADKTIGA